jgi:hypothetical protein
VVFDRLDLTLRLKRTDYERELRLLQGRLHLLGYQVYLRHCRS